MKKTAEIFRDHVTEIEDIHSGIEVSDKDVSLIVPFDLIDFDQLEVRLENWRPPGSSPEARRLRRIANLNQASNEREEQTRMMEARKAKNRRELLSLFSKKRKRY
ncbi:MAG: hypothetical protein AB8G95_25115 [Anaerolineae bacterium]